jgi:hypothetical protein
MWWCEWWYWDTLDAFLKTCWTGDDWKINNRDTDDTNTKWRQGCCNVREVCDDVIRCDKLILILILALLLDHDEPGTSNGLTIWHDATDKKYMGTRQRRTRIPAAQTHWCVMWQGVNTWWYWDILDDFHSSGGETSSTWRWWLKSKKYGTRGHGHDQHSGVVMMWWVMWH